MAKPRPTFLKRQKERARLAKQAAKARRRTERKAERAERDDSDDDEAIDPDIAGIIPGPQPIPWEDQEIHPEVEEPAEED